MIRICPYIEMRILVIKAPKIQIIANSLVTSSSILC